MRYSTLFFLILVGALLSFQQLTEDAEGVAAMQKKNSEMIAALEDAVESGEDLSGILPDTAAGQANAGCTRGVVTIERVGKREVEGKYKASYVSYEEQGRRYIQVVGKHEIYLAQQPYQFTTAQIVVPDEKLQGRFGEVNRGGCVEENLYLSKLMLSRSPGLNASIH